jgi:predicted dehydrogenase
MKRRTFIQQGALVTGASLISAQSYARIIGANERVRVGVVGFSDRFRQSLLPSFQIYNKEMNFEIVALSDIWNRRREEGKAHLESKLGNTIKVYNNNDELYASKSVDAVFISTADFQHALHLVEAVKAGCDVYCEKPLAETMEDARLALKSVKASKSVVQIGSQRRSAPNYHTANDFIRSGQFGPITMVEMSWNVNQPGRWRRPELVKNLKESDVDWKRYLMNRPAIPFDARKYLEYRLFWPFSSGIPGQWMCHQIDTVHWFTGLKHPRSIVANGGVYWWKDGRVNPDTLAMVMEYGPENDPKTGFQVLYQSRFHNEAGGTKEIYFSNGGELNLDTNRISPNGGLRERDAKGMGLSANLLTEKTIEGPKIETSANTGGDPMTALHVKNWMDCVRSRKETNAPIEAGYSHSIACIMANAAYRSGQKATFDALKQEVMVGGKVFKY